MTDQYQWQSALAAAEHAVDTEQIEAAADSLQIALSHISTYKPNDPARLPILATFIRSCERAIERAGEQSIHAMKERAAEVQRVMARASHHAPLTFRQVAAQLPDELENIRNQGRLNRRLRNTQTSATYMLLDSEVARYGEDSAAVVETLLTLEQLEWVHAGHEDDTFALLQRALAIRERMPGTEHPDTLNVVGRLASRYDIYTSYEQAIPLWQRLLYHAERTGPVDRFGLTELLAFLGKAYYGVHLYTEAKNAWKRFLDLTKHDAHQVVAGIPTMKFARLNICYGIGYACLAQEEWAEAASFLALAVASHRTLPGFTVNGELIAGGITLASGIATYAEALARSGAPHSASALFEEAFALHNGMDRQRVELLRKYAAALRASGDTTQAANAEHEASALMETIEAER